MADVRGPRASVGSESAAPIFNVDLQFPKSKKKPSKFIISLKPEIFFEGGRWGIG